MKTTRPERRPDQTATTALLLMVLVLATSAAGSVDRNGTRTGTRNGMHGATGTVSGLVTPPLVEAPALPGSTLLAPPSDTLATVGTRSGSDVAVDLAHLAGTSMQEYRCQRDLPPPHRA